MPRLKSANFAVTELKNSINDSVTSLTVNDASLFPSEGPFMILVHDSTPGFAGVKELMEVGSINKNTNTLSDILRGRENTPPVAHSAGARVECVWTAGTHAELEDIGNKGKAGGYASLDTTGNIPAEQLGNVEGMEIHGNEWHNPAFATQADFTSHLSDITAHKRTLTYLTYYVNADTGNDNNQGTFGAPFKTIKKAIDSIPVGTAGWVKLLGNTAFSIDTPIYVYNKVVVLGGELGDALINITSTIYLIDSTFSINRINMYAETSDAFPAIFYCSGIVGIKCGGYDNFNVRPLQETSNINFISVSAIATGDAFFTRPVAIYLIGDRLNFKTDNYPSYSGTFNVFAKNPYYTFPVVFTRWWQMTKDANVNWGATEYQLGSSGTSLWYFEGV